MVTYKCDLWDNGIYREGLCSFGFFYLDCGMGSGELKVPEGRRFFKDTVVCLIRKRPYFGNQLCILFFGANSSKKGIADV